MRPNLEQTFCKGAIGTRLVAWISVSIMAFVVYRRYGWNLEITYGIWDVLLLLIEVVAYTGPIWSGVLLIYNLPKNKLRRAQRKYSITWSAMDEDYQQAQEVVPNCCISERFSYYTEYTKAGKNPFVIKNKDIVWVYPSRMQIDTQSGFLNICTIEGKIVQVTKTMEQMEKIINYYRQRHPHIIFDDPIKVKKLYKTDMDAFLDIKYNKVIAAGYENKNF